jgi:hypothetical protein
VIQRSLVSLEYVSAEVVLVLVLMALELPIP